MTELFTSEGCSSCPPADDLLHQLTAGTLADLADVITLGEHVDYWDRLGWRDHFSDASFSARQSAYGALVFGTDNIYTPQMVIDGRYQVLGSSLEAIRRAVGAAAVAPKAKVEVDTEDLEPGRVRVLVKVQMPAELTLRESADVMVAVTEDDLVTHVMRGENGGRTLRHGSVARLLKKIGHLDAADRTYAGTVAIALQAGWQPANLRIVAFLQERGSRHIVGAGGVVAGGSGVRQ
ncbi:MAG: DUF1223 domain-containing protein [Acidobacteriota bacterium]